MKLYESISALIEDVGSLQHPGWVFVNKKGWSIAPTQTPLMYLWEDGELEENVDPDTRVPTLALERDMDFFLEAATFHDIVEVQSENRPTSTIPEFVDAINHYREYDSFKD